MPRTQPLFRGAPKKQKPLPFLLVSVPRILFEARAKIKDHLLDIHIEADFQTGAEAAEWGRGILKTHGGRERVFYTCQRQGLEDAINKKGDRLCGTFPDPLS